MPAATHEPFNVDCAVKSTDFLSSADEFFFLSLSLVYTLLCHHKSICGTESGEKLKRYTNRQEQQQQEKKPANTKKVALKQRALKYQMKLKKNRRTTTGNEKERTICRPTTEHKNEKENEIPNEKEM